MPTAQETQLYRTGNDAWIPFTYVYRRDFVLTAGRTYHFQTRNLTGAGADPFMYLLRNNTIVASNDDYSGLASEIVFTPTATGSYRVIIRAYTTSTPGFCDLYQGIDGMPPSLVESNVRFAGTYVHARWHAGEWFETAFTTDGTVVFGTTGLPDAPASPSSDPYLLLITAGELYWDDDSGEDLNSKIVPPSSGMGTIIVGAYSRYTEGVCMLGLVNMSYKSPWMSPAPWSQKAPPVALTGRMKQYVKELQRAKAKLDRLTPGDRDTKVLELQRRILSEEEIRLQAAPPPNYTVELARRQKQFLSSYAGMEKALKRMSYADRSARLSSLKREIMGPEYSEPAPAKVRGRQVTRRRKRRE